MSGKRKTRNKKRTLHIGRLLLVLAMFAGLCFGGFYVMKSVLHREKTLIVIDPGFGGDATGFTGYVNESEYAEQIASRLETLFAENRKVEVVRTHDAETGMDVNQRSALINDLSPAAVLSLRADTSSDPYRSGMTIYADVPGERTNKESLRFAGMIAEAFEADEAYAGQIVTGYQYFRLIKQDTYEPVFAETDDTEKKDMNTWPLMEKCNVPVVIVSGLYVSNEEEVQMRTTEEAYDAAAQHYYDAILKFAGGK